MKTLLKNGTVLNVFTDSYQKADVLIEEDKIIGVGNYSEADADVTVDLSGKYICPGFIDGHIHIESTMLTPAELAKICLPHGTTAIVADPHEIANVCGITGIKYMLAASKNLPLKIYFNLPSCVPASPFDESSTTLFAKDLKPLYRDPNVLGLAEMMNFPGVIAKDEEIMQKISDAHSFNKIVDGHAPLLRGNELDSYISAGIQSDHECSQLDEAIEKLSKGQWIMIRQGTAAKNLNELLPLFSEPYSRRCLLVTDDIHPADINNNGEIDNIIRLAIKNGVSAITAIRMATIQAAQCFGLKRQGAIAPGYTADIIVLNNIENIEICDVYTNGKLAVKNGVTLPFKKPRINSCLTKSVYESFHLNKISIKDFYIKPSEKPCRIIKIIPEQITTEELIEKIDWSKNNGIDIERDILKLAVLERHNNTGHKGVGFINGIGLKKGAIASSVSHDSHNIIVIGTNDADMAIAANRIRENGGNVVVVDGEIIAEMPLRIAGLMSEYSSNIVVEQNASVRRAVHSLGIKEGIEPFMNMAFVSLSVIPALKMTTQGLLDVNAWKLVPLEI